LTSLCGFGLGLCVGSSIFMNHGFNLSLLSTSVLLAMTGTYLCLIMMLLASRMPWLEREMGHDKMVLLHRKVAPVAITLIAFHILLTTIAHASQFRITLKQQFLDFIDSYPWMIQAVIAASLMLLLSLISYRKIRKAMRYEVWWALHLLFYVAVILAFGHQIYSGSIFIKYPFIKYSWIALYVGVFVVIIFSRFVKPIVFSLRHKLKIDYVVRETDDVYSIYIKGRDLDKIYAHGGQFFQWRFLTSKWWWQAHPYSLSRSPKDGELRITVKVLGDHSYDVARRLRPNTKIFAEGPYGVFTAKRREGNKIAAFASGIGITPIFAMLEELPPRCDVSLIYRVSSEKDVILFTDLEILFLSNKWKLYYLIGDREQHPMTKDHVLQYIPDLSSREVYVCGSESFMNDVITLALNAGVVDNKIYHESFSF